MQAQIEVKIHVTGESEEGAARGADDRLARPASARTFRTAGRGQPRFRICGTLFGAADTRRRPVPPGHRRVAVRGSVPGTMAQSDRATVPNTMSSGRTGTRFSSRPVAARIAATIAGVLEIVGGSPTPFAP